MGVTATGGANGTRTNISGTIVPASNGRLDYVPVSHASRGILIEPATNNILIQTEKLDNGLVWVVSTYVITGDSATAPDGNMTSDTLTCTTGGAVYQAVVLTNSIHTCQIWAKAGTGSTIKIGVDEATYKGVTFNVSLGTITATDTNWSGTITAYPNGWYLCTATRSTALTAGTCYFTLSSSDAITTTVYAWGAMLSVGATATYISVDMAAAPRDADQIAFTVPAGVSTIRCTFDDATTQDISVSPGALSLTSADLNETRLKTLVSV